MTDTTLEQRVGVLEDSHSDLTRRFDEAFPGGDHAGHCRYHQLMIEAIEEKKKLRMAITEKTVSGLLWAGMIAVGTAVWQYIKSKIAIG